MAKGGERMGRLKIIDINEEEFNRIINALDNISMKMYKSGFQLILFNEIDDIIIDIKDILNDCEEEEVK